MYAIWYSEPAELDRDPWETHPPTGTSVVRRNIQTARWQIAASRQQIWDDRAMDVGQAIVATLKTIGETLVVKA